MSGTLADRLPEDPSGGAVLDAFLAWCAEQELDLYPHQEEAILELFDGSNVVLSTPTGSGKSLVALALHAASLAAGRRSWYTAPVKALVSEKFFALCRDLGPDNVGLITGDATVNPEAPVICATAEILAGMALRHGAEAPVDDVVMDEFHYYGDPGRGVAWQIPLVTLSRARFLLLSATLGPVDRFLTDLRHRTGRRSVEIGAVDRPVPLDFTYRETPLLDSVAELVASGRTPVYVVHFTQAAATEQAQALLSVPVTGAAERKELGRVLAEERFSSPFGKELRRALAQGVGIHHAGMLPRYRLLVERLAQAGLLRVVCGTDTLGVGVNIPIRTVLFARLCKYDGSTTRVLDVREFHQI
ncbi:MAG: DEAD/DEAH box helicase, partial [Actinobacteria bacterium]|nr:DEAD/DEAH box helicase [Actinomycetota bacterium]